MIAKPDGVRISAFMERPGWQAHTVQGALSRLHKQGHQTLAPAIVQLIVAGGQPMGLTTKWLSNNAMPSDWHALQQILARSELRKS